MKKSTNKRSKKSGCWSKLKKLWQCVWSSGGSICDCPKQAKSAQDIRDEYLKKCPWIDNQL